MNRVASWCEHHPGVWLVALLALDVPVRYGMAAGWWTVLSLLLGCAVWTACTVCETLHRRDSCDHCWQREYQHATRSCARLHWFHYLIPTGRILVPAGVLVILPAALFSGVLVRTFGLFAALLLLATCYQLARHHAWLHDLCPWCRDDDDGDGDMFPVPGPTTQEKVTA